MLPKDDLTRLPRDFDYGVDDIERPRLLPLLYWFPGVAGAVSGWSIKPVGRLVRYGRYPLACCGLVVGSFLGVKMERYRLNRNLRRNQMHEEYMRLHPERFDFPRPPRIGDLLEPWHPRRSNFLLGWFGKPVKSLANFPEPQGMDLREEVVANAESRRKYGSSS